MLVVKVELWPFGNYKKRRTLAKMKLWNAGSSSVKPENPTNPFVRLPESLYDYKGTATYLAYPSNSEQELEGEVIGYNRLIPNVWRLVHAMLGDMIEKGIKLKSTEQPFIDHVMFYGSGVKKLSYKDGEIKEEIIK